MNKNLKLFRSLTDEQLDRVIEATIMCEQSPVDQVATYTGVKRNLLEAGVNLLKHPEWLNDKGKPDLLPTKFYENLKKEVKREKAISPEDIEVRFQTALNERQSKCKHSRYFVRCPLCVKILGSELNYFSIETMFHIMREAEYDLKDNDHDNEIRHEFCLLINDRMQRERLSRLEEEEDEEPDGI